MLRLAIVLGLAAACFAQTKPNIAETFESSGNYEYHDARGTHFGMFLMNRDQDLEMAVENATYKVQNTSTTEHFERLEICNGKSAGEIYTLRDDGKEVHCEHQPCIEVLPMFWGWVANAKYEGTIKIQEVTYDEWVGTCGAGIEIGLAVLPDKPNTPQWFEIQLGEQRRIYHFLKFMATTPPTNDFKVPPECQ